MILLALTPSLSHAACTPQEAREKGDQVVQLLMAKGRADPAKGQELMVKMRAITQSYQGKTESGGQVDWGQICAQFDEMMQQAQ